MPNDILEYIWKEVQDNTNAPLEYRSNCLKSVAYLWRRWKSFVKTNFYDIWDTNEERLAHRPSRVVREQWEILVEYWGTEKQKGISATNKQNCQSRELPHKTGRTPFAVVRRKMEKAGEKTDRISVFKKTRSRNGDGSLDRETADVVAVMENLRDKVPEAEQTPEFIDGVFTKVLGPDGHGCVRTYGLGPTRSTIFGKGNGASTSQFMSMREQIREEITSELGPMLAIMEKKIREDVRAEILAEREKDTLGGTGQTTINVPTSSSVHCNSSDVEKERSLGDEDLGEHECFKI